jgi:hypothetical protein
MKKENEKKPGDIKTDLKHDTMEFSASSDGEDPLDIDDTTYEEEEISAEELDILEDEEEDEAAAYVNAENELSIDEDLLPEEDWTEDLEDPSDDDEEEEERR